MAAVTPRVEAACEAFVGRVTSLLESRLAPSPSTDGGLPALETLVKGKMLRTRLAAHLLPSDAPEATITRAAAACAAVEVVHTASLFHDDVIDGGSVRRAKPSLWTGIGPNAAILAGDILFCEALAMIQQIHPNDLTDLFLAKVKEVCVSEIGQELVHRGSTLDVDDCVNIARSKTGPLFAFTALACVPSAAAKREALELVGYEVGAAYQLADDLLDEKGTEEAAGKSLGTDRLRNKYTLAQTAAEAENAIGAHVERLCSSAMGRLESWPEARAGLWAYLEEDLFAATPFALAMQ